MAIYWRNKRCQQVISAGVKRCSLRQKPLIPIAFSKSLSCRQLCLGIITMHYLEQMSRRPQLPEGFNDVDF
ncbi:hypothetical protein, partial [Endozoicomonas atrinae]|uniref:hypothetical protein n=1 Tax=Endozoicomonas atrinae TaxID=1333660 RepID=UPI001EE7373D